jgi:predicted ATP-grasp superfamily ATP-dependent carboligase
MGEKVERSQAKAKVGWLRLVTDLPTVSADLLTGHTGLGAYLQSLKRTRVESIFAPEDPMPSIAEVILLPYLVMKKYFSKSNSQPAIPAARDPETMGSPVSKSR